MNRLDRGAWKADLRLMFGELYHNRVLELAADIPHAERLVDPQGSSLKVSRVCGSTVAVDVNVDAEGRIAEIGVDPKACALGQAATSILARHAIGRSLAEMEAARDALRAMLKDGAEPPQGDFWELRHLQPVRDYPPRHASTMLAFEAVVEAMKEALARR
ncbi:MAG: iron-sulfur cluster assembly scaffold protein [Hyphomonadaceae bacterium]|nr:iron-sulfur cluster assembly scaffold protein [Hyphomonadaceae bacterium]